VFDPLARMKAPNRKENDQDGMSEVIDFWRALRSETGAAVALVHHTGHTGEHMRGTSDLESVWESRLAWKREGQASIVELTSEHREAEAAGTIRYCIDWNHDTRTMCFDLEHDPLEDSIRAYLANHPDASANEIHDAVKGKRTTVLALVKTIREGGSQPGEPPGNHPGLGTPVGGSPAPSGPLPLPWTAGG